MCSFLYAEPFQNLEADSTDPADMIRIVTYSADMIRIVRLCRWDTDHCKYQRIDTDGLQYHLQNPYTRGLVGRPKILRISIHIT